ncbi:MAG: hypothetical protein AAF899_16405 [Pseudomonadota bacterium]
MSPLGFSDLSEDEALVVSIYRGWVESDPCRADYERTITARLDHDPLCRDLAIVFDAFSDMDDAGSGTSSTGPVLSPVEERLLDDLSKRLPQARGRAGAPAGTPTTRVIRPPSAIERTGSDALLSRVNAASWRVAACL